MDRVAALQNVLVLGVVFKRADIVFVVVHMGDLHPHSLGFIVLSLGVFVRKAEQELHVIADR